jgi:transcriptional regulator with XRE-family HTH domain
MCEDCTGGRRVEGRQEGHVSERFGRLLDLYRKPDGSAWGGQDLERATGGAVTRSYVSNLRKGRIGSPGLDKLEAIAGAMGFPPQLWFGEGKERTPDAALAAVLEDGTAREILGEVLRMRPGDRRLLLGIARQIPPSDGARGA